MPCEFIESGVIHLSVRVTDHDDNERICLTRVAVHEQIRADCC